MLVVVDLVAEEDRLRFIAEDPWAVMRRLARAEVDDGERYVVEGHALAVSDRGVREDPIRRPLLPEHRTDDLVLECVVGCDRVDHSLRGVDRDVVAGDDLVEPGVVVGMGVRQNRCQERLPEAVDTRPHLLGGGDL